MTVSAWEQTNDLDTKQARFDVEIASWLWNKHIVMHNGPCQNTTVNPCPPNVCLLIPVGAYF